MSDTPKKPRPVMEPYVRRGITILPPIVQPGPRKLARLQKAVRMIAAERAKQGR